MKINLTSQIEAVLQGTINPLTSEHLLQYQNQQNGTLDLILNLCQAFTNQVNMEAATISQNQYGQKFIRGLTKKNNKYNWAQLNVYGAKIIYLIRQLLHEEGISFLLGVSNGATTRQVMISQYEMMTHMEKVQGRNAVGIKVAQLDTQLKALSSKDLITKRVNQWTEVQRLGTVERYNGLDAKTIEEHKIYNKIGKDDSVWVKFSGKNQTRSYYYDLQNNGNEDTFVFYNVGWLYQWYNAILQGEDDEKYNWVQAGIQKETISPIIGTKENIAGTKQGDYLNAQGQWVQAKYNNETIISYNNIKVIMYELTTALLAWKEANYSPEKQEKLRTVLQTHFYPDAFLVGNEIADTAFEQIITTLKSGLSNTLDLTK